MSADEVPDIPEPEVDFNPRAHRHARRKVRWSPARKAGVITLCLFLSLVVSGAGSLLWIQDQLDRNIERIQDPFGNIPESSRPTKAPPATPGAGTPMDILVVGSDSRISAGDPNQWKFGAQRTDAIMLLHIAADRKSAYVMSIPRDSWVDVPGYGDHKINASFAFGGPSLLIQTVEQRTGVRIDHLAVTDFESFQRITDTLGGVELDGELMDGKTALKYVRTRYGLPRGDFDRVKRQQAWVRAVMAKVLSSERLSSPAGLYSLTDTVSRSVALDEGFTMTEIRGLLLDMRDIRTGDVSFFTVPIKGTGWSPDGKQSIVLLDDAPFDELMAAVKADKVAEYLKEKSETVDMLGSKVR